MTSAFNEFKGVALINTLRSCQLFTGLPQADLEQIAAVTVLKSLEKGEYLIHEGDPAIGFYVIQRGAVNVQYETLAAFRYALRQFLRFSEEAALAAGITPQQHQALLAIKGFPGRDSVTVGELAERLQLRHHSAVGLIDRLMVEKMVSRAPSDKDRRHVLVQLNKRGENVLEKLSFAHQEQLKHLGPEMSQLLERLGGAE